MLLCVSSWHKVLLPLNAPCHLASELTKWNGLLSQFLDSTVKSNPAPGLKSPEVKLQESNLGGYKEGEARLQTLGLQGR